MRAGILLLSLCAACSSREPLPVAQRDQALIDRLPAAMRERVDRAPVAVLLPRTVSLARANLVTEASYSALSVPLDGLTVSLHSARIAHRHPLGGDPGRARSLRGTTGYTTVNEGIRTATWIEGGVAHALDLECASPEDARCGDDRLLLELVDSLSLAGGGGPR